MDRLARIVDVEHQVPYAVNDDQAKPLLCLQSIFYQSQSEVGTVLSQSEEHKVLTVHVVGQSCKPEDALHHAVTVETALLRINVEYLTLVIG